MGFCNNCGSQVNGEAFCPMCGASIVDNGNNSNNGISVNKNNNKKMIVGIAASAVAVIIAILVVFNLSSGIGYKAFVKDYMNANKTYDAAKLASYYYDGLVSEFYNGDRDVLIDQLEYMFDLTKNNDVDMSKMSYDIKKARNADRNDINRLEDKYDCDIKTAKEVDIEYKVPSGNGELKKTIAITIGKIGNKWYVLSEQLY